jgi:hypothetical protein
MTGSLGGTGMGKQIRADAALLLKLTGQQFGGLPLPSKTNSFAFLYFHSQVVDGSDNRRFQCQFQTLERIFQLHRCTCDYLHSLQDIQIVNTKQTVGHRDTGDVVNKELSNRRNKRVEIRSFRNRPNVKCEVLLF